MLICWKAFLLYFFLVFTKSIFHDVLGIYDRFIPRFSKRYKNFHNEMEDAFCEYKKDVEEKGFPTDEHTFKISDDVWKALLKEID